MIEHVIFDFFGTLVTYTAGIAGNPCARALAELQTHDVVLEAAEFERRFDGCFAGLEAKAQISHEEYSMHAAARLLFAQLGIVPSAGRLDRFIAAYLQDWNSGVKPLPRLNVWMNSLPVCKSVLTNTHQPGFVPDHLERLGIRASRGAGDEFGGTRVAQTRSAHLPGSSGRVGSESRAGGVRGR